MEEPQSIPSEPHYPGHGMHRAADDTDLRLNLPRLLNRHCRDNGCNTPDFIRAAEA